MASSVSTVEKVIYRFDFWLSEHRPKTRAWRCHMAVLLIEYSQGPGANVGFTCTNVITKDFYGGSYDSVRRQAHRWQKRHYHHVKQDRRSETLMASDEVTLDLPARPGKDGKDGGDDHGS